MRPRSMSRIICTRACAGRPCSAVRQEDVHDGRRLRRATSGPRRASARWRRCARGCCAPAPRCSTPPRSTPGTLLAAIADPMPAPSTIDAELALARRPPAAPRRARTAGSRPASLLRVPQSRTAWPRRDRCSIELLLEFEPAVVGPEGNPEGLGHAPNGHLYAERRARTRPPQPMEHTTRAAFIPAPPKCASLRVPPASAGAQRPMPELDTDQSCCQRRRNPGPHPRAGRRDLQRLPGRRGPAPRRHPQGRLPLPRRPDPRHGPRTSRSTSWRCRATRRARRRRARSG